MTEARIALTLSGGGFRASLFHLGVLRRLHELGVLDRITTVSSVSGGSIVAAFLADRISNLRSLADLSDWEKTIARPFRAITARDFRSGPVLRHALWSWCAPGPLARAMVKKYRKYLTQKTLNDLPKHPNFIFCATDVSFAVNWIFSRDRVGDYQAGYIKPAPPIDLAFAVGASACFPPLFGPLKVPVAAENFTGGSYRGPDRERILSRLALTDGGVYDNLGLEPALKNHDTVIVSDAGGPFPFQASRTPLVRYMRYPGLVMKQVSALRKRQLMAMIDDHRWQCNAEHDTENCRVRLERDGCFHASDPRCRDHNRRPVLRRGVYLGLQSDVAGYVPHDADPSTWVGYDRNTVKTRIAGIRTDLDRFTPGEQQVLENHGYCLADAGMRRHLADVIPAGDHRFELPHPEIMNGDIAAAELAQSHRRFSIKRSLKR